MARHQRRMTDTEWRAERQRQMAECRQILVDYAIKHEAKLRGMDTQDLWATVARQALDIENLQLKLQEKTKQLADLKRAAVAAIKAARPSEDVEAIKATIAGLEATLAEARATIAAKDQEIARLNRGLAAKQDVVAKLQEALQTRDEELKNAWATVQAQVKEIKKLKKTEPKPEAQAVGQPAAKKGKEPDPDKVLAAARSLLEDRDRQIAALKAEVARLERGKMAQKIAQRQKAAD